MKTKLSQIISFSTLSLLLLSPCVGAPTVTVNLKSEKQSIRGFGGMIHLNWQGYDLNASDRELAFGNGAGQIGLTVLRIPVYDLESEWNKELSTAKYVISKGGIVYASPWTPPEALRTPYSFVRWNTTYDSHKISASNYTAYATHLNKFAKYMKDNGAPLHAISIQNEPDWCDAWTCWSADEVYNFVKSNAASLRQQGTKVITAESFAYGKGYYDKILNDASALQNIDIIGAHFYGTNYSSNADSAKLSYFEYPLADQKGAGKERWMTEHYTDSKGNANLWRGYIITGDQDVVPKYDTVRALDVAYEIHRALAEGNFNQYTWWYIRRNYGLIMHTINPDPTKDVKPIPTAAEVGKVTKRGYCVAQYAKFVRPGAIRVDATQNPDRSVYVSAYKKADSVIIVAVNRAGQKTIDFSIPEGTVIKSWKKYTTSETKSVTDDGSVSATNGAFSVSFDKESVTTLVGILVGSSSSSSSTPNSSSSSSSLSSSSQSSSSAITQAAYSAAVIPGVIQAENYDLGGEGVAYQDLDVANKGGAYRADGVDVEGDEATGYKISYTQLEEWLKYTVDVSSAGVYDWEARVSAGGDGSAFRLLLDGVALTDTVHVPNTTSWSTYTTVTGTTPSLMAGTHELQLVVDGPYFNIDWIQFTAKTSGFIPQGKPILNGGGETLAIYSITGTRIGLVTVAKGASLSLSISAIVPKQGVYLAKSVRGGATYKVFVKENRSTR